MQKIAQNSWVWVVVGLLIGAGAGYVYFSSNAEQKCVYEAVREQRLQFREDDTRPYYETQGAAEVLNTVRTFVELVATGETQVTPASEPIYNALKSVLDECGVKYRKS